MTGVQTCALPIFSQMNPSVKVFSGLDLLIEQAIHQILLMWGPIAEVHEIRTLMMNAVDK